VVVSGTSGRLTAPREPLNCRASGTTLRLLMGVCGGQEGTFTLDGEEQLRRRPVGDMESPLAALGARVRYAERDGYPPVVVTGNRWSGAEVEVPGAVSSQFLSGLMIASSLARGPVSLSSKDLVSSPYAEMTAAVMARFGGEVDALGPQCWRVDPADYRAADFEVEPDASSAAFLWAAAAVTGGEVLVRGTGARSLQGDALFPDLLARMGCRLERTAEGTVVSGFPSRGLETDCSGTPDLVPALAAVAAFAPGPSTFCGVAHLRFKESDRLAVLTDALSRLGATVLLEEDRMTLVPAVAYHGAELDPRGDHRMAMAFAILGLRIPWVRIAEPSCVAKSFPNFFTVLESLLS
jgi:3-phosphoshikimate 1-carboxyvinyltransferase